MKILSNTAHAFYVILSVVTIAAVEVIAISIGEFLLSYVIETYLPPTLAEDWMIVPVRFIPAFVVGMFVPYSAAGNKWPFCHLLTVIALTGMSYQVFEEMGYEYLFVFLVAFSSAGGLWMGSAIIQRHIRMSGGGELIGPVMATEETEELISNAARNIRYLLIGTALITFALASDLILSDIRHLTPTEILTSFIWFYLQYLILIALTYLPPNASDRQAIILWGGRLFIYISTPILLILFIADYDFYIHLILTYIQRTVVLLIIILCGIDAIFDGIGTLLKIIKKSRH